MAYMTVLGWTVKLLKARPVERRFVSVGPSVSVLSGERNEARIGQKRQWSCTTAPMTAASTAFLRAVLMGRGHVWSLDGELSSSGGASWEPPTTGTNPSFTSSSPFYGKAALYNPTGTGGVGLVAPDAAFPRWTLFFYSSTTGVGSWDRYALTSTGLRYKNGAVSTWTGVAVKTSTAFVLHPVNDAGAASNRYFSHIVAIPEVASAEALAAMTGAAVASTPSPSPLPRLSMYGDFVGDDFIVARANVTNEELRRVGMAQLRALSFDISEA